MEVTVRFFAVLRERIGRSTERVGIGPHETAEALWEKVVMEHDGLRDLRRSIRFAINGAYASPETVLRDGDEVAFLPPMSGGSTCTA